jgi:hypothetical protein
MKNLDPAADGKEKESARGNDIVQDAPDPRGGPEIKTGAMEQHMQEQAIGEGGEEGVEHYYFRH